MSTTEHDTDGTLGEMGGVVDPVDLGMPAPGGAFDDHHPPDAALIGDCVHCGFCLPTCPTYVLWGEEMDSPRGRIYLMKEGLEGEPMTDSMVGHFDACLGCMACVTACPSGVQYDTLIEQTRAQVERHHERPAQEKALRGLIFALFPHPRGSGCCAVRCARMQAHRPRPRAAAYRPARPHLARTWPRWSASRPRLGRPEPLPEHIAATGTRRATVGLLTGCVQGAFFPGVNAATARVLRAEGCDVVVPRSQGCCGALSVHNGREEEAQGYARALDRRLRVQRRRARRRQRGRLRLLDEGVRRAAGRRPGVRRRARRRSPTRSATSPRSSTSSARSPRATRSR